MLPVNSLHKSIFFVSPMECVVPKISTKGFFGTNNTTATMRDMMMTAIAIEIIRIIQLCKLFVVLSVVVDTIINFLVDFRVPIN